MQIVLPVLLVIAFSISFFLSFLVYKYGKNFGLLDVPNKRSLHTDIVPRGAGLGFIISFFAGIFVLNHLGLVSDLLFKAFFWGGIPIALVGLLDDRFHTPILIRLVVHTISAVVVLCLFKGMPPLDWGFYVWHWHWDWFGWFIGILGLVWLTNFYNFMDGMDGLSGSQGVFVCIAISLLLLFLGKTTLVFPLLLLCFSILGFLVWNFPPAKLFMGDSGSGFLGFIFGIFLIASAQEGALMPWQWLIVFGTFWVDATVTLLRRACGGEKCYEAHSDHAFQHAIKRFGSKKVLTGFILINLFWCFPLALLSVALPSLQFFIMVVSVLPLFGLAIKLKAGVSI